MLLSRCADGCGPGTCDEVRGVCACPMGFEGARCERWLLPDCKIGIHPIPVRSWVLQAFHDGARRDRWPGDGHPIGPVPCLCLEQLVSTPFLIERTRLQYMRSFNARCVNLESGQDLKQFLEQPPADARGYWRVFSFAAAHDALRLGATPSLFSQPLDATNAELPSLVRRLQRLRKMGREPRSRRIAGYHVDTLLPTLPGCLLAERRSTARPARTNSLPPSLVALSRCGPSHCGGLGWCEAPASEPPTCGCFVPGGLKGGVGGPQCTAREPWRADLQPNAHWGPPCLLNCSGRGACDWQGFCRCGQGFWGIDCALSRGVSSAEVRVDEIGRSPPRVSVETVEAMLGGGGRSRRRGAPLKPISSILAAAAATTARRRGVAGAESGGGSGGSRAPLIYVVDMPPIYRFGVDFAPHVEMKLTERLLRSSHRAASAEAADYLWLPGAPLVIEGHRLLARLWHVASHWLPDGPRLLRGEANASSAPRPLVLMPLLTERASMDSFQLSYSDNDREEWPGLERAEHVQGIFGLSPGCRTGLGPGQTLEVVEAAAGDGNPRKESRRKEQAAASAASASDAADENAPLSPAQLELALARALLARRRQLSAGALVSLFGGGGYESFAAAAREPPKHRRPERGGCLLPDSLLAWSPTRFWAGVQFNGNTRGPVWFQRGRDIVIPQLLLLDRGGKRCAWAVSARPPRCRYWLAPAATDRPTLPNSAACAPGSHADQPSCKQMAPTSPFSPAASASRARTNRLWFGGHSGHDDARTAIFRFHSTVPGFVLLDSKRDAHRKLDAINMSLTTQVGAPTEAEGPCLLRHLTFGSMRTLAVLLGATWSGAGRPHTAHGRTLPRLRASLHARPERLRRRVAARRVAAMVQVFVARACPWHRIPTIPSGQCRRLIRPFASAMWQVPTDELRQLPSVLEAAAGDQAALRAMQAELACAWRSLFWTSLLGSCFGEPARGDAFDGLIAVLRRRLQRGRRRERGSAAPMTSACEVSPSLALA